MTGIEEVLVEAFLILQSCAVPKGTEALIHSGGALEL